MTASVGAFLKEALWFQRNSEGEESLIIFYVLYSTWCGVQGVSALSGDEFYSKLPPLGLTRVGEYIRGVKFTERGEQMAGIAARALQEKEEEDGEEDVLL